MSIQRIFIERENGWHALSENNYFSDRILSVKNIANGIVLPAKYYGIPNGAYKGGVVDENFNYLAGFEREAKSSSAYPGFYGVGSSYVVDKDQIEKVDNDVIFGGVLVGHFGHFILECLPARLWYPIMHPEDKRKIVFITILSKKEWFFEFFELLGIDKTRVIFIDKPTQFYNITVPEECIHSWYNYTKEYMDVYRYITSRIDSEIRYEKIYLSHREWGWGCECINEDKYEELFEKAGYKVIEPEKYSIKEQIQMVHGASEIITTMGTLAHFALFCNPNTKFSILTRKCDATNKAQCLVNQASEVDWYLVDVDENYLWSNRTFGPVNFQITNSFREFSQSVLNIPIVDQSRFPESLDYIKAWTNYYSKPDNFKKIYNLSIFDVLNIFSYELFGEKLDRNKYHTKEDLLVEKLNELQKENANIASLNERLLSAINRMGGNIRLEDYQNELTLCLDSEFHVANLGWTKDLNRNTSGKQIEAVKLKMKDESLQVFYTVYDTKKGWSREYSDGEIAGTTGESLPITSICIRLSMISAEKWDILYRVYDGQNWSEWSCNGEPTKTLQWNKITDIEINIVDKEHNLEADLNKIVEKNIM